MIRVRQTVALPLALLASLALVQPGGAQGTNQGSGAGSGQKQIDAAQGSGAAPAQGGLKRRDLKGQAMSQSAEPEGLTPEQKKMYEEIQQQLQQIKENRAKSDAALQELMKEDGR
ncbi:MAG: hypothetical protein KGO52_03355 [Nitrospirota bacterium]|nr:hypothetical protein [Nitrospirota bacterium]MDE3119302.1 hypothetical protein [Nitrospirota bacterium]MDE3241742.1 hypothetical protein [Nitrospirota bacterium]